eukprot:1375586-Ditylum_brightwellii.AAC.1
MMSLTRNQVRLTTFFYSQLDVQNDECSSNFIKIEGGKALTPIMPSILLYKSLSPVSKTTILHNLTDLYYVQQSKL